jgi:hypothetical protein
MSWVLVKLYFYHALVVAAVVAPARRATSHTAITSECRKIQRRKLKGHMPMVHIIIPVEVAQYHPPAVGAEAIHRTINHAGVGGRGSPSFVTRFFNKYNQVYDILSQVNEGSMSSSSSASTSLQRKSSNSSNSISNQPSSTSQPFPSPPSCSSDTQTQLVTMSYIDDGNTVV